MKKVFYFICLSLIIFLGFNDVKANSIDSINMDIFIDDYGNALVTETWSAYLNTGTEGYKPYYNLGNSSITNFKVSDGSTQFNYLDNWNTSASFEDKKYKNGINVVDDGVELCWGISNYGHNTYTLNYTINNFIYKTSDDYQMLYWTLVSSKLSSKPGNVSIKVHANKRFSDKLDVWGYGNYGGTAYVYDGRIEMNSDGVLDSSEYMTLLVKFPKDTFIIENNSLDKDFNYYYDMAEDGAESYKEKKAPKCLSALIIILQAGFMISILAPVVFVIMNSFFTNRNPLVGVQRYDFGSAGRTLSKKYEYFRDLPCNKDIFRAYWVAEAYNLNKSKTDLLGAVLLKWIKEKVVSVKKVEEGTIFKKEDTSIIFNSSDSISNNLEKDLYDMMYKASEDGVLETKEFEKWCKKNYEKILAWFDDVLIHVNNKLMEEGKVTIQEKVNLKIFKTSAYAVDPSMKEEAEQLAGLKRFLKNFSNLGKAYPIEVNMWEEYLMFAQILGIAKQVAKDVREIYPNEITEYQLNEVTFIYSISSSGMISASQAHARANAYSSGGGGFSSGGGGGGSFGGGSSSSGGGGFR